MARTPQLPLVGLGLFLGSGLGLVGCSHTSEEAPGKRPQAVSVSVPLEREVTDYQDYTGRTASVDSVQIQARVTGYLTKIYFKEGEEVEEGTVLYEIDPAPYKAAFDAAKSQVDQNVAALELARQNLERANRLAKGKDPSIAKAELDQYESQDKQAVANLDYAKANLVTADLNLGWTKVTAPVAGIIGRLIVTRGNLITANQTTLTTLVAQDPMWVYFDADEPTVLQVHELIRQGKFGPATPGHPPKVPFRMQLFNEKGFPHEAALDFVNNQLDLATATLLIRATFPNPTPANGPRLFSPNMFVRVRVPTSGSYQALLVSPEAVGTDQDLKYVYVVEDDKVVRRAIKLGSLQDGLQVITDGLKAQDRVIVNGIQRVQQGAAVNPTLEPMPTPPQGSLTASPPPVLKVPAPAALPAPAKK